MVRLDRQSMVCLTRAADLRRIDYTDCVRLVAVTQARHDLEGSREDVIASIPEQQLAFWQTLSEPAKLTAAQRRLGASMRGEV